MKTTITKFIIFIAIIAVTVGAFLVIEYTKENIETKNEKIEKMERKIYSLEKRINAVEQAEFKNNNWMTTEQLENGKKK